MISLSRRATLASAALLACAIGAGLATVVPAAQAATAPTVTGGSALGIGATKWAYFTVTGTGFVSGDAVSFTSTATTAQALAGNAATATSDVTQDAGTTSVASADGKTLTAEVTVSATATEMLDVVVTAGTTAVSCYVPAPLTAKDPGCVTIDAAPTKLAFSSSVGVGAVNHPTAFTATGLQPGTHAALVSPDSPAQFTAPQFTLAASATGGTASISVPTTVSNGTGKSVTLINGDGGEEVKAPTLTVTAPPTLSAVSPTTGDAGQPLTIVGTSKNSTFTTSPVPTVVFLGRSYPATNVTTSSFTANVGTVPSTTEGGAVPITVINGDGGSDTERSLFSVIGAPSPPSVVTQNSIGNQTATVMWQPVATANDGGAPIVSYDVTTTPDTGNHIVLASAPSSITLNTLTNGTTYTATVAATNSDPATNVQQTGTGTTSSSFTPVGPVVAAPTAATLPTPTTTVLPVVSLKASKTTINFASPVTISGKVTLGGSPLAGTAISLQAINAESVRTATGETTTTGSDGSFSFKAIYPSYTSTFGVGVGDATTTAGVKVTVAQYLTLTKTSLSKTRSYVATGLGTPGTTDKKASVVLFRVTKTGHRVGTITKTVLARGKSAKGYSDGISTFTLKATLKRGSYLVAVAILGTSTNGPVQTKPFTIKVP